MSFGVISSTAAAAQSPLAQLQSQLLHAFEHASTGKRINSAADDPSGLAISETISSQANAFDAASRNVADASNALTVADGALQTTSESLGALSTIAVAAGNDLLSAGDRANLQTVANQLVADQHGCGKCKLQRNAAAQRAVRRPDPGHAGLVGGHGQRRAFKRRKSRASGEYVAQCAGRYDCRVRREYGRGNCGANRVYR